ADNPIPCQHFMIGAGDVLGHSPSGLQETRDTVSIACHGLGITHLDALCHMFVRQQTYNGRTSDVVTSRGATANDLWAVRNGIFGRGVLLDVPGHLGTPYLEPAEAIEPDTLDAVAEAQGVLLEAGDIVLVSTGREARRREHPAWDI